MPDSLNAVMGEYHVDAGHSPALVNLATFPGQVNGLGYAATILDLAGRNYLSVTMPQPGRLWCQLPWQPIDAAGGLADFEQVVLASVSKLASGNGAPFEVLADSFAADVPNAWEPFDGAVRAAGRRAGLTRPFLSVPVRWVLGLAGAALIAVGAAVLRSPAHADPVHLGIARLVEMVVCFTLGFGAVMSALSAGKRHDRLTPSGRALAASARRLARQVTAPGLADGHAPSPSALRQLAIRVAVGASVPLAGGHPAALSQGTRRARTIRLGRGRSGQSVTGPRPQAAWSSLTGQWRLVQIGQGPSSDGMKMHEWLVPLCFAGILALIAVEVLVRVHVSPLSRLFIIVPLAVPGVPFGVSGARLLHAWLNRRSQAVFDGQVIARWDETHSDSESNWVVHHLAVDDGRRGWNFEVGPHEFELVATGDAVRVCHLTYSGRLVSLEPLISDAIRPMPG